MTTGTNPATLAMLTLDCGEVGPVADFWAAMLGYDVVASGDGYAMLRGPEGAAIGFGEVPDYEPPAWPNERGSKQFHLDLAVDDLDAAAERAVELGASLADPQPGETWRVLIDPAGHPFCLTKAENWG
jgi:predicted enzyme related to lactoylglutathione lyase